VQPGPQTGLPGPVRLRERLFELAGGRRTLVADLA
jgi:hypothetical protein